MKIVEHKTIPKIDEVLIQTQPLRIWLDTHVELVIEKGDKLQKVVKVCREYYTELHHGQLMQLVAFWFALGERSARGEIAAPWTKKEVRPDPNRRYLSNGH